MSEVRSLSISNQNKDKFKKILEHCKKENVSYSDFLIREAYGILMDE